MQYQNNRAIKLAQYLGNKTGSMYKAGDLMGSYNGLDPRMQAGLLGAGGGALIGGLGNAIFGDSRDGLLSRLLSGAASGGVVGGLGGAGAQHFGLDVAGPGNEQLNKLFAPKASKAPHTGSYPPAGRRGENAGLSRLLDHPEPEGYSKNPTPNLKQFDKQYNPDNKGDYPGYDNEDASIDDSEGTPKPPKSRSGKA